MRGLHDYFRAVQYLIYSMFERIRGLDFSLRDNSDMTGERHGYAMTSDGAMNNIANRVDFTGKSFLDIGSGKGRTLVQAMKHGALRADGVEYLEKLHQIAERNIARLGLSSLCKSHCIDALEFTRYGEYDLFFLFNPFEYELYRQVIDVLFSQCSGVVKERHIVCYGDGDLSSIEKYEQACQIYEGICPHRKNRLVIFKISCDRDA